MAKWMYLWSPGGQPAETFASRARAELAGRLAGLDASEIALHLTERRPPRLSIIPFTRASVALISVWGPDEGLGARAAGRLSGLPGQLFGYRVEEAVPLARPRSWDPGEVAPGVCLLTVFRRHKGLDRQRFLAEWHGRHTPMSLGIHPMIAYVRNTVLEPLDPGAPDWDGIVTEAYPTLRDLSNPVHLFGGPLRALPNMLRVGRHIATFMDLRSMRNYLVSERILESAS
ncbi:MAG: hypothetical protein JXR96_02800 [Deltaproteobacteria bacterium]|nr:hypothetical protein [Deltaproteobacteria bacterium]